MVSREGRPRVLGMKGMRPAGLACEGVWVGENFLAEQDLLTTLRNAFAFPAGSSTCRRPGPLPVGGEVLVPTGATGPD